MSKLIRLILSLQVLAFFIGCSSQRMRISEIGEYKIIKKGPFIVSDSPELWKFLKSRGNIDKKKIQIIISNGEPTQRTLYLDKVVATINQEKVGLKCRTPDAEGSVVLQYGKVVGVTCNMDLVPNSKNQLGLKDTFVSIEVPNDSKENVVIERLYRIEDFL
ncbi:hypothetical protein ACLVWU_12295 [Bdellovibrio sp. HCB290]|uniref:hypothetical protein n=1 Tax=Bdellovibrio sp. HCB290 TaxID=3394356 RepID=UPI0039B4B34D